MPLVAWFFTRQVPIKAVAVMTAVFIVFSVPLWWRYLGKEEVGFRILGALSPYWRSYQVGAAEEFNKSQTEFNAAALRSNEGPDALTDPALVESSRQIPMGWYLLEKNKPSTKDPIEETDLELMTSDSRYRFTLSRLIYLHVKLAASLMFPRPS